MTSRATPRTIPILTILLFLGALAVFNGFQFSFLRLLPFLGNQTADASHFLSVADPYGITEHDIYYFNHLGIRKHMSDADIIFVGNSRMQMGLEPSVVRRYLGEKGLKAYNLALGDGEGFFFARRLLSGVDLSGKLVVMQVDEFTLRDFSETALDTFSKSRFKSFVDVTEKNILFGMNTFFLRYAPAWLITLAGLNPPRFTVFRSVRDGMWMTDHFEAINNPASSVVSVAGEGAKLMQEQHNLDCFIRFVAQSGGLPALIQVPFPGHAPEPVQAASRRTGAPFVPYDHEYSRLWSFDNSHLTRDSAARYSSFVTPRLAELALDARAAGQGGSAQARSDLPVAPTGPSAAHAANLQELYDKPEAFENIKLHDGSYAAIAPTNEARGTVVFPSPGAQGPVLATIWIGAYIKTRTGKVTLSCSFDDEEEREILTLTGVFPAGREAAVIKRRAPFSTMRVTFRFAPDAVDKAFMVEHNYPTGVSELRVDFENLQ